jgi:hypothetical protein
MIIRHSHRANGFEELCIVSSSPVHTDPEDGSSGLQGINTQEHRPHHCPCCEHLKSHIIYSVQITTPQRRLQMRTDYFSASASLKQRQVMNNLHVTLLRVYSAWDERALVHVLLPLLLWAIRTIIYANEFISLCREMHFLTFKVCGKPTVTHVPQWLILHMQNAHLDS